MKLNSAAELTALEHSHALIVQDFLQDEKYSIDVLADAGTHVISAVPRLRARLYSGVSFTPRTVHDAELNDSFDRRPPDRYHLRRQRTIQS